MQVWHCPSVTKHEQSNYAFPIRNGYERVEVCRTVCARKDYVGSTQLFTGAGSLGAHANQLKDNFALRLV
jgi:hypothetical protein